MFEKTKNIIEFVVVFIAKPVAQSDIFKAVCCFLLLLAVSYCIVANPIMDKRLENHPLAFYVFGGENTIVFQYWYQFCKIIMYAVIFIGVAYVEELMFRYPILLLARAKGNEEVKRWLIIIFSILLSLLFMICHFKVTIALYILMFVWGCFLSWVVVRTKTLRWAVAI